MRSLTANASDASGTRQTWPGSAAPISRERTRRTPAHRRQPCGGDLDRIGSRTRAPSTTGLCPVAGRPCGVPNQGHTLRAAAMLPLGRWAAGPLGGGGGSVTLRLPNACVSAGAVVSAVVGEQMGSTVVCCTALNRVGRRSTAWYRVRVSQVNAEVQVRGGAASWFTPKRPLVRSQYRPPRSEAISHRLVSLSGPGA
jgi:hypothetical protein